MFKWSGFRFSLLTLLLVVTLAAVSVSHWRLSGELAKAEQKLKFSQEAVREKQRTIRELNDEIGRLTVDDESQVHVIAQEPVAPITRRDVRWDSSFAWSVHLPAELDWQLCWGGGEIPPVGIPKSKLGQRVLRRGPQSSGTMTLSVEHLSPWASGQALVFRCDSDVWSGVIPRATVSEFRADEAIYSEIAGTGDWATPKTDTFPAGSVVLLRQWREGEENEKNGIVVWLEPVAKQLSTGEK